MEMVKPELNASGGEKPPSPKRRAERDGTEIKSRAEREHEKERISWKYL